jgi:hypothetical protein
VPRRQQIGDVLVHREWWNRSVAKLLRPHKVGTGELHRLRGPLVAQDFQGIWLAEAPSNLVRAKDKSSPVLAQILIPWNQVVALAIIDDPTRLKPGFTVTEVVLMPETE